MTRAFISADGRTVTLAGDHHKNQFPSGSIDRWIAFYERMIAKRGGHERFYGAPLSALMKARDRLREARGC